MRRKIHNKGFSIVSVLIAAGMMGGLSLIILQLSKQQISIEKKGETEMELGVLREQIGNILYNDTACIKTIRSGTLIDSSSVVTPIGIGSIKNQAGQDVIVPHDTYGNGLIKVISISLDNISITNTTAEMDLQITFKKSSRAISGYNRAVKTFPLSVELDTSGRAISCNSDLSSATVTAKKQICKKLGGVYNSTSKKCQSPIAQKCTSGLVQRFNAMGKPVCITPQNPPPHPAGKNCFLISLYDGHYAFKPLSDTILNDSTQLNKWRHTYKGRSAKDIDLGANHSCAILDDNTLKCWGDNTHGQLGDGTTSRRTRAQLVNFPNNRHPKKVVLGKEHSCAILDNNTLRCWGNNQYYQLGDGTNTNRKSPVYINVGSGRNVKSLALGGSHTCAILDNNDMKCWGRNNRGQIGLGYRSDAPNQTPISVNLGTAHAKQVALGDEHTCALLSDNSLKCWGLNSWGQLGTGNRHHRFSPVDINVGTSRYAKHIQSGTDHVCAILDDNSVTCWGRNDFGQLGTPIAQDYLYPGTIINMGDTSLLVEDMNLGRSYSCAVLSDSTLKCWGKLSMPGYARYNTLFPPVAISLAATPQKVTLGNQHVCVTMDDNYVHCWGRNAEGQLGSGITNSFTSSIKEVDLGDSVPTHKQFNLASCPSGYTNRFFNPMSSHDPIPSIPPSHPSHNVGGVKSAFMEHYCCK